MNHQRAPERPVIHHVVSGELGRSVAVVDLVDALRRETTGCVFACGGAGNIAPDTRQRLLQLFGALPLLASRGVRFVAADGGTNSGVMEAIGLARSRSPVAFPLLGVTPAPEILGPHGAKETVVDPHHSHVIAVHNPRWPGGRREPGAPAGGYWGAELETMRDLFGRLADGRPSVAVVANGGPRALDEIRMHLDAGRRTIFVAGSGRAADAIVSILRGTEPADPDTRALAATARDNAIVSAPGLCDTFDIGEGAAALADRLEEVLQGGGRNLGAHVEKSTTG
jgi:hypothetical protein